MENQSQLDRDQFQDGQNNSDVYLPAEVRVKKEKADEIQNDTKNILQCDNLNEFSAEDNCRIQAIEFDLVMSAIAKSHGMDKSTTKIENAAQEESTTTNFAYDHSSETPAKFSSDLSDIFQSSGSLLDFNFTTTVTTGSQPEPTSNNGIQGGKINENKMEYQSQPSGQNQDCNFWTPRPMINRPQRYSYDSFGRPTSLPSNHNNVFQSFGTTNTGNLVQPPAISYLSNPQFNINSTNSTASPEFQSSFPFSNERKMRRNINDDQSAYMRSTYNRTNQISVDFELMTRVFNSFKAPYELPYTKEQVIECYDWYLGALQYNYVPGKRKQTFKEKHPMHMESELKMVASARKKANARNEVIVLD